MRRGGYLRWGGAALLWLGCAILACVPCVEAQAPKYKIAVLTPGLAFDSVLDGLREALAQAGFEEGKQLTFLIEDTKGEFTDLAQRAVRLVEAGPDVLFTVATSATGAAKNATTTVPIVFAWVGDPVKSGFVASYASSKNNLTGVSVYSAPLSGKRLEVLGEIDPRIKRVLAVVAVKEAIAQFSFEVLEETAKKLDIQLLRRDVTTQAEIEQVIQETPPGSVDAIYHVPSGLVGTHIDLLIAKAKADKIPLAVTDGSMVKQGALFSYGGDFKEMGAQAAKLVVKILKGTKPADLPIQTPDKLLLSINLTTAKAIGLDVPRQVRERADRLLE